MFYFFFFSLLLYYNYSFSQCAGLMPPATSSISKCSAGNYTFVATTYDAKITSHRWYNSSGVQMNPTRQYRSPSSSSTWISEYSSYFTTTTWFEVEGVCSDGSKTTRVRVSFNLTASKSIIVSSSVPLPACQGTTVVLTAKDGTGFSWYKDNATPLYLGNTSSINITESGVYYVKGYNICNNYETIYYTVTINPTVGTPSVPAGLSSICQGTSTSTYTSSASNATSYIWSISNAGGSTISSVNGTVAWDASFKGTARITVTAKGCNNSSSSNYKDVIVNSINIYEVSGGGAICSGGTASIFLSGSESGATYQLSKLGTAYGSPQAGNGGPLRWEVNQIGDYTIQGTKLACINKSMKGSVGIIHKQASNATISSFPVSSNLCAGTSKTYTVTGGSTYSWYRKTENPNTPFFLGNTSSITVNQAAEYYVIVKDECGFTQTLSQTLTYFSPTATITPSGSGKICSTCKQLLTATTGTDYSYQWKKDGSAIAGATSSTYEASVSGVYSVDVRFSQCTKTSNSYSLTINVPPTVSAGMNKTITLPINSTSLIGSASDPDGGTLTYLWTKVSGGAATLSGTSTTTLALSGLAAGTYVFKLTVSDGLDSRSANVTLYVIYPANNYNYVRETIVEVEGKTTDSQVASLIKGQKSVSTTYFDGLGRPMQKVEWQASPTKKDIIQPIVYDQFGRDSLTLLPYTGNDNGYFKPAFFTEQSNFYKADNDNIINDNYPFSRKEYEPSPLNRVLEQGAPGAAWQLMSSTAPNKGHSIKMQYTTNNSTAFSSTVLTNNPGSRRVALYTATINSNGTRTLARSGNTAIYGNGELYVNIVKNENWLSAHGCLNTSEEYTDKEGRVVLKRTYNKKGSALEMLSTYYVYDDFGLLSFVLPPRSNPDANVALTQATLDNLCYQYRYDERGRMTEKKVPGKGWEYMVYNKLDKIVMTQDAKQRAKAPQEWTILKYDALGRSLITGLFTHSGSTVNTAYRSTMQNNVNGQTSLWEVRSTTGNGYTARTYPTSWSTTLSLNYYDDYNFPGGSTYTHSSASQLTKGMLTGSKVNILGTATMLLSLNFYDDKGRLIVTYAENSIGGWDRIENSYDFAGKLLQSKRVHKKQLKNELTLIKGIDYDHAGRVIKVKQKVNTETAWKTISHSNYNEIGQLIAKSLHSLDNIKYAQKIDYKYNIRGWLTHINDANISTENDLFGEEMKYEAGIQSGLSGGNQYNGNISEIIWNTRSHMKGAPTGRKAYGYTYDGINRLTDAKYVERGTTAWDVKPGAFNEEKIAYDLNGNIQYLVRNNLNKLGAVQEMDKLTYSYTGNILKKVEDAATVRESFIDDAHVDGEYGYDINGNISKDDNKGLTFVHNYLNLLERTNKGTSNIQYVYTAAGEKIRKTVTDNGVTPSTVTVTDYVAGIEYIKEELTQIPHDEGRLVPKGTSFDYEYFIKDHLGNVRVTFTTGTPDQFQFTTGLETTNEEEFKNVASTRKLDVANARTGSYSAVLNGSLSKTVGPAIAIKVVPGDVINMEVWAKYTPNGEDNTKLITGVESTVANTFKYVAEGGATYSMFNPLSMYSFVGVNTVPRAYLNYVFFDKKLNYVKNLSGFKQVTSAASGAYEKLSPNAITVQKEGYLYIYVANESSTNVNVFFDDLKITQTEGQMLSSTDYYPFGAQISEVSWSSSSSNENKYLYNGKELQDDKFGGTSLGWSDYGARMYDPVIGRWGGIDRFSDAYATFSPYNFVLGNPIANNDVNGEWTVSRHHKMTMDALSKAGIAAGQSRVIAHYASVYADNPGNHIYANNLVHSNALGYYSCINYHKTANSQETNWNPWVDHQNYNVWHSMRSSWEAANETISTDDAMYRGMNFGWDKIFQSAEKGTLSQLKANTEGMEDLGQGLHALQDGYAHKGRHDVGFDHLKNDIFGNTSKAEKITDSALMVHGILSNDSGTLKMLNNGRVGLDLAGIGNTNLLNLNEKLTGQGYQLQYNWNTKEYDIKKK